MHRDPPDKPDRLLGTRLGDYLIKRRIAAGGMGIVYEGVQPVIGKRVAIKVLRNDLARNPVQVQRLLAEARAVNSIRHRGIIDIFGGGKLPDGRRFIVMEYLEGSGLDEVLRQRRAMQAIEVLPILDEVLSAVGAAHRAGVIHRDLKPSNIFLVRQRDGNSYVKVLDFGIAKDVLARARYTAAGEVVGTPEYMAPELVLDRPPSPAADLYSFGILAFELLTGTLPFRDPDPFIVTVRQVKDAPPHPRTLDASIPEGLDALIMRLLSKSPSARPASAEAVRHEMRAIMRSLVEGLTRVTSPEEERPTVLLRPTGEGRVTVRAFSPLTRLPEPPRRASAVVTEPAPPPTAGIRLPHWVRRLWGRLHRHSRQPALS